MASVKRTPATNERLQELRRRRDAILSITPVRNQYTFEGTKYTKRGYDELLKKVESDIAQVEKELRPSVFETTQAEAKSKREIAQETQKVRLDYNSVQARRKDIEKAIARATTVEEQRNLQGWLALFNENERRLKTALDEYESGRRPQNVPQTIQLVPVDQMKKSAPTGPMAPEPGTTPVTTTATTTTGMFGQEVTVPGPGVAAPQTRPTTPSRMPSLEQINAVRANQNLPALELVNGKYREVGSKKEVPASEVAASTGTTPTGTTTVPGGGTGGQAVGGTTTGAAPPAGAAPGAPAAPAVPTAWEQAAREQFGAYYEVIKNDPEIMKLIEDDITLGLSDQQYQARLEQTRWWRTTTASARAWEEDKARDPATLQTRIDNQLAALRDTSLRLGLRLRDDVLAKLAEDSLKFGWSNNVIQNAIGSEALKSAGGVSDLRRGYIGQTLRTTAGSYGVPLSDVTFNEWVGKIATGQENEASFQAYALDLAKNLYPSLAASLDKGISFRAITDPYRQAASRILEVNPETIDFADPKWAQAFTARNDKGEQMMMTYGEWNDYLRTNPTFGYEYTDGAKERAFTVANRLAELFGAA